jgi:hypothetical protein
MMDPFLLITAAPTSHRLADSAPPSKFAVALWLAAFLLLAWLSMTGRLAESVHRSWKNTPILPGIMSDLPTLKKIYRWFGVAMLLLISVMCVIGLFHHI